MPPYAGMSSMYICSYIMQIILTTPILTHKFELSWRSMGHGFDHVWQTILLTNADVLWFQRCRVLPLILEQASVDLNQMHNQLFL